MALSNLSFGVLLLVTLVFVWQTFRRGQLQWLWFSVALWLVLGWFSGSLMPRVLGITHWPNAFLLHVYIFVGSVFFWLNSIHKQPENRTYWQSRDGSVFLTLLATSSLVIHCVFALLAAIIAWLYPTGLSVYAAAFVWQLYTLDPINIWAMHAFLMAVFYLHRHIQKQRADQFNLPQLQIGGLLILLWLIAALYQRAHVLVQR